MKILVPYPNETVERIREIIGTKAEVVQSNGTVDEMLEVGHNADILTTGRVPSEYIRNASSLKMIQTFGAGIDKIDRAAVLERDDLIVCNNHVNAEEVSEYAIMLLLASAKHILHSDRNIRKGDWSMAWGGPLPNYEIRKKTVLIIGLGNIGKEIARRLRAFDMHLIAATRSGTSSHSELVDEVVCIDDISPAVRKSDFVILSLPLTNESEGLVDADFLSLMKKSATIINISRGQIIDEGALYRVLSQRSIAGAALDVWWDYPDQWGGSGKYPSENYPFHELDNVVLSPHRAAYSENIVQDQIEFVGENILRFIRGDTPLNIVDMNRGY